MHQNLAQTGDSKLADTNFGAQQNPAAIREAQSSDLFRLLSGSYLGQRFPDLESYEAAAKEAGALDPKASAILLCTHAIANGLKPERLLPLLKAAPDMLIDVVRSGSSTPFATAFADIEGRHRELGGSKAILGLLGESKTMVIYTGSEKAEDFQATYEQAEKNLQQYLDGRFGRHQ